MSELSKILVQSGLGEKESAVYLAACELGPSGAQEIAQKSGVHRATVYICLESLEKKGFGTLASRLGRTVFLAERPEMIRDRVRSERLEKETIEQRLNDALPELSALYNVEGHKPQVMFLEGVEGLREHQETVERLYGPYWQITNIDDAREAFGKVTYLQSEHQERLRKHAVQGKALLVTSQAFSQVKLARLPVDVKMLHYEALPIHGEIIVQDDMVLLVSFRAETFVTKIRSVTLAKTMRALFELAWKGAESEPGFSSEERMTWPDSGRLV